MAFEFLKPENNWRTHCGDQPTFGRFSTRFDFPTKAITQATDYPPKRVNLGCITCSTG